MQTVTIKTETFYIQVLRIKFCIAFFLVFGWNRIMKMGVSQPLKSNDYSSLNKKRDKCNVSQDVAGPKADQ